MNKKGFTLIEVIVSIILVSVVLVSLLGSLIQLRSTYSIIHDNADVIVYTSSITRVINNDLSKNNGIRYVSCNFNGDKCDLVLGNDSRRRIEILRMELQTVDNGITALTVQTTLKYSDTTEYEKIVSPKESDEELIKIIYIRTLDFKKYINEKSVVTTEGYVFDSMSARQYEYDKNNEIDAVTTLNIKINDTISTDISIYDINLYATGRYDYSELYGKSFTINLDSGDSLAFGTYSIDEVFGVGFFKSETNHKPKDLINSITIPTKENKAFLGYYYKRQGNNVETQIIDSSGRIIVSPRLFKEDVGINPESSDESRVYAKWGDCNNGYELVNGVCLQKEFTVTLNKNGGSNGSNNYIVKFNNYVPDITIPQKDGYTFQGYTSGDEVYHDSTGKGKKVYSINSNSTLNAQWNECSAGTYSPKSSNACSNCVTGSYSNSGSSTCSACQNGYTTSGPGKNSCSISCSNNNGHIKEWEEATWSNNTVSKLCTIKTCNTGYNLVDNKCSIITNTITLNGNGATTSGSTSTTATYGNTTLGSITVPQKKYTISFNANSQGATISSTASITSTYTFSGWYTASSGGSKVASNAATPSLQASISGYTDANKKWIKTSDTTLYAQWTGGSITLPTITKTGHTCSWNGNASGTGTTIPSGHTYSPGSSYTLYAICTPNYTVTYADNLFAATSNEFYGVKVTYTENGSYLTMNGTPSIASFYPYMWNYERRTINANDVYKITIKYISGTLSYKNSSEPVYLVLDLTKNGSRFSDRGTDPRSYIALELPTSGTKETTFTVNSQRASANGLEYWLWQKTGSNATFTNYKVQIIITKVHSKSVTYGSTYGTLDTPTKTGYTFNGWYTAVTGGTKVVSSSTYNSSGDTTLYAQWTSNKLKISYNGNGSDVTWCSTYENLAMNTNKYVINKSDSTTYIQERAFGQFISNTAGFSDYNNTTGICFAKTGYKAKSGSEYILNGKTTTYNQATTTYISQDIATNADCNLSTTSNCTVRLNVNWIPN